MVRAEPDPQVATLIYWRTAVSLLAAWALGATVGANGLTLVDDLDRLGFDVALPALLLGLLVNNLRDRSNAAASVTGASITFVLLFVVPPGAAVLAGGLGAGAPLLARYRQRRKARS